MDSSQKVLQAEIESLQKKLDKKDKVIIALRERVQRGIQNTSDSYAVFERNIYLQKIIEEKTKGLHIALTKAETSNRAKSEFLANMSHELRTPLHAIISFSDFGKKDIVRNKTERVEKYFSNINVSGKKLLALLNNLLDLSKFEAEQIVVRRRKTDVQSIVDIVLAEQQTVLDEKNIRVKTVTPECETDAYFDPIKIEQVIRNIMTNAIKFSTKGNTITISYRLSFLIIKKDQQPSLEISFADQGVGIPNDELESVFDKFIQSSKTSSLAGGTGLGLAICKSLIELNDGQIWAEQNPGGGSIFKISLLLEKQKIVGLDLKEEDENNNYSAEIISL
ncbi:MAG: sensor histidine kinase [Gammaproteobacteria bacterium]